MLQVQESKGGYGRSGGCATKDSFQAGQTIITDGSVTIRIEDTGDSSRSYFVSRSGRYADSDVTCDAPLPYREAIAYWTEWLERRSALAPAA